MRNGPSTRKSSAKQVRRGTAAVEFAIIAPLLFLLLAGVIEFGQAFRIEHLLANAARRGARTAITDDAATSQVLQKVKTQCVQTMGVNETDVTVELAINGMTGVALSQAEEGDEISLTVRVPFSNAGVGFYAKMFSNSVLSSTCTLEHE